MVKGSAIILTNGWLNNLHAKTCHGLLRGSERFNVLAVVDAQHAGRDAGEVMDGQPRNIPVYATIDEALEKLAVIPDYAIVGVAVHGGKLPPELRKEVADCMQKGMSIVCGLHTFLSDDPEFQAIAKKYGVSLIDVRKPRPVSKLHFWTGEIYKVKTPRITVLGTDCALGKRTTAKMLTELCRENGIAAEMIYTGQTGWMQGSKHGFIFDSTVNDFIGGEIERVIVECEKESKPQIMFIEGQSALRNPGGPCGSEFILSGNTKGIILQHAPAREMFEGYEHLGIKIPSLEDEIALIRMYGAKVLAVTLNEEGWSDNQMRQFQKEKSRQLGIPMVRPLVDGLASLLPVIAEYMQQEQQK